MTWRTISSRPCRRRRRLQWRWQCRHWCRNGCRVTLANPHPHTSPETFPFPFLFSFQINPNPNANPHPHPDTFPLPFAFAITVTSGTPTELLIVQAHQSRRRVPVLAQERGGAAGEQAARHQASQVRGHRRQMFRGR
jgi:hypothetical protein